MYNSSSIIIIIKDGSKLPIIMKVNSYLALEEIYMRNNYKFARSSRFPYKLIKSDQPIGHVKSARGLIIQSVSQINRKHFLVRLINF